MIFVLIEVIANAVELIGQHVDEIRHRIPGEDTRRIPDESPATRALARALASDDTDDLILKVAHGSGPAAEQGPSKPT